MRGTLRIASALPGSQLIELGELSASRISVHDRFVRIVAEIDRTCDSGSTIGYSNRDELDIIPMDALAATYTWTNWESALISGLTFVLRRSKSRNWRVVVREVDGQLGSDDMSALANEFAILLARLLREQQIAPTVADWTHNIVVRARYPHESIQFDSPLENYLREIDETALLTADEEKNLACRVMRGDTDARDQMVRANLRLVVMIARGYTGKGLALQDLIEEGNLGLLRAVEGFDPTMNARFSTYASYWIKQSIKRALVNTAKTIRIPAYMVELLAKWRSATNQLTDELGRPPTNEETAKLLGLPKKKISIIQKAIRVYSSAPQTDQTEAGWSIDEMLSDGRTNTPDTEMVENDDLRQVMHLLDKMDPHEATVLRMRFGLNDEEPKTLKEIGEALGLTRERVRQIESEALVKLNENLSAE
jgi:RNA polymerase primary sigma factor